MRRKLNRILYLFYFSLKKNESPVGRMQDVSNVLFTQQQGAQKPTEKRQPGMRISIV